MRKRRKSFSTCVVILLTLSLSTSWAAALTAQSAYAATDAAKTASDRPATAVKTWKNCRYEPEIPQTVLIPVTEDSGRKTEVTGYLQKVVTKKTGETTPFTVSAVFEGDADCRYYLINGRYIPAAELSEAPDFESYEQELLSYLQLDPAVYTITGARWLGGFTVDEATGKTIRKAEFSATAANLCDYEAYYREAFPPAAAGGQSTGAEEGSQGSPAAGAAAGTGSTGVAGGTGNQGSSAGSLGGGPGTGTSVAAVIAAGLSAGEDGITAGLAGAAISGGQRAAAGKAAADSALADKAPGERDHGAAAGSAAADNALADREPGERDLSAGGGVFGPAGNIDAQTAAALALLAAAVVLFIFSRRRPLHAGRGGKSK